MNVKASVDDTMNDIEIWQRLDCDYMSDMKIAGNFRYGFCVFFSIWLISSPFYLSDENVNCITCVTVFISFTLYVLHTQKV